LHAFRLLAPVGTQEEFHWTAELLKANAASLQQFTILRNTFEKLLLNDRLQDSLELLDTIEQQFGSSIWLISHRIHVLQAARGLEAQKSYAEAIRRQAGPGAMAAYLTFFLSIRSEPTVTLSRLSAQLEASLSSFPTTPVQNAYVRFHVLGVIPTPHLGADLLRYEQVGSLVDLYEMFVALAISQVLELTSAEFHSDIASLADAVRDHRLHVINAFLNSDCPERPDYCEDFALTSSHLLAGRVAEAYESGMRLLTNHPTNPDVLFLQARIAAIHGRVVPDGTLLTKTMSRAAQLMVGGAGAVDEFQDFAKLGVLLHASPIGAGLLTLIEDEGSPVVPLSPDAYRQAGAFLPPVPSPFWLDMQPAGAVRQYTALGSYVQLEGSLAANRGAALADETDDATHLTTGFSSAEADMIAAVNALRQGRPAAAVDPARRLSEKEIAFFRRRGWRLLLNSLLASGQVANAVVDITTAYLSERGWATILPIQATTEALRANPDKLPRAELSVPILYDMYAQHVDASRDMDRVFAYEDVLAFYGVDKPSQLAPYTAALNQRKLVYFLRYVCVESIMDRTIVFDSSRSVLEERLAVCRLLLTLDPASSETYHDEIKAIAKRLRLSRRMRQLEQSKIYVDAENLRRKLEPELREGYARYTALRRERPLAGESELREAFREAASGNLEKVVLLRLPKHEISDLFTTLVNRFRDEYTTSPEYGLDKYLSVRIRHGTLAAHLRRPVEAAHLITSRDSLTGKYRVNEYWPQRLPTSSDLDQILLKRLAIFSEAFDKLVDEVKGWVHVSTDSKGEGMFDFTLREASYLALAHVIGVETSYDSFAEQVIDTLDQILDSRLEQVRERIENETKRRALSLLEQLASDVQAIGGGACGELVHAIRAASTDLQIAIDRIARWFMRTSSSSAEPFSISEAIDIGIESVKTIDPQFEHEVEIDFDEELALQGALLTPFVDVLFIVLENVIKHSGEGVRPKAHVSATLRNWSLRIRVSNPIAPETVTPEAEAKLQRLRAQVLDRSHSGYVRREGESGFHKLARILQDDVKGTPQLTFGFVDGREFVVELAVPVRVLSYEDTLGRGRREQAATGDGAAEATLR
jgi:hypothetical protein